MSPELSMLRIRQTVKQSFHLFPFQRCKTHRRVFCAVVRSVRSQCNLHRCAVVLGKLPYAGNCSIYVVHHSLFGQFTELGQHP